MYGQWLCMQANKQTFFYEHLAPRGLADADADAGYDLAIVAADRFDKDLRKI